MNIPKHKNNHVFLNRQYRTVDRQKNRSNNSTLPITSTEQQFSHNRIYNRHINIKINNDISIQQNQARCSYYTINGQENNQKMKLISEYIGKKNSNKFEVYRNDYNSQQNIQPSLSRNNNNFVQYSQSNQQKLLQKLHKQKQSRLNANASIKPDISDKTTSQLQLKSKAKIIRPYNDNKSNSNTRQYKARSLKCISQTLFNNLSKQYQQQEQGQRIIRNICHSTAQTPFVYLKMHKIRNKISRKVNSLIKLQISEENNLQENVMNPKNSLHLNSNLNFNFNLNQNSNNNQQNYIHISKKRRLNNQSYTTAPGNIFNQFDSKLATNIAFIKPSNTSKSWMKNRNYKSSQSPSRFAMKCQMHRNLKQGQCQSSVKQCLCNKQQNKVSGWKKDCLRPWSGLFLADAQNI